MEKDLVSLIRENELLRDKIALLEKQNAMQEKEKVFLKNENQELKQLLKESSEGHEAPTCPQEPPSDTPAVCEEVGNKILKIITGKFHFTEDQLGENLHHEKITNGYIAELFRRCFGKGSHPSKSQQEVIDDLWILLVKKRQNAPKSDDELFYRQTVLNIIGYFWSKRLLRGQKKQIAQAVFPDATDSLAKNVSRGIDSPVFPEETKELLDYYINQLLTGEF